MKSLAELNAEVQTEQTLDGLVEAIIFKSGQNRLTKSQARLQQVFYMLQKEFPILFSDLIFDESGISPFSDELDAVLFRLEASNVLHTLNPGYRSYLIEDSIKHLQESYDKFLSIAPEIDRCALLFSELIMQQAEVE